MNYSSSAFLTTFDLTESQMAKYIIVHSIHVATDFVPQTFGRLTTIGPKFRLPMGTKGEYTSRVVCSCVCGGMAVVSIQDLQREHTQSCGCLQRENTAQAHITHGMRHSPEYNTYYMMRRRCLNIQDQKYSDYGGRGIRVCDRWLAPNGQGFMNFLADMGPRPSKNLSIERKLVNGDYCPENCCWATKTAQARNRRSNHMLTFNSKTQCIAAWAEELGCTYALIRERLRRGWSVEKTLTTPGRTHNAKKNP
jgi:hypothetical protein